MRKRIIYSLLVTAFALSSYNAFAGCEIKCITRDPFSGNCLIKTKVCGISIEGAQKELERGWNQIESAWHQIYGTLPIELRSILNNYPMTIVGAAYGGYEGALLGAAIDRAVARATTRAARTKEFMDQLPPWKDQILLEGYAIATGREISTLGSMQRDKEYLLDGIEPEYEKFLQCVAASEDPGQCRKTCLKTLDLAVLTITYGTN